MIIGAAETAISARESFGSYIEYLENYDEHIDLRKIAVGAHSSESWGNPQQILSNINALQQALLHRAIGLFEGALNSAATDNFYSMTTSIRGHFETTAALGNLHSRIFSLKQRTIDAVTLHRDVSSLFLGTREKDLISSLKRTHPYVPEARNVLSMLEYADKSASVHFFGGKSKEHDVLTDCYSYLSEFCHPNFHSNRTAIEVDHARQQYRFRHDQPMRDDECKVLGYILISGPIFVGLFKIIDELVPSIFPK